MKQICSLILLIFIFIGCNTDNPTDSNQSQFVEISGSITEDTQLQAENDYRLIGQTFVKSGVTLNIEAGTTIKALPYDRNGSAPVLVIETGAKIIANGTADMPITFTSALDENELPQRGLWGGLVILGKAPINQSGGTAFVEGLSGIPFGGNDPTDNSGILRYVRVWYGGRSIGDGNELNGITLAGVGSGTTIEFCEVAWNNDDGFEFFGGTVNVRNLSTVFCGDDAFDVDWGYQGKGQFLFALLGQDVCGRGFEMDNDGGNMDAQPRSFPQFHNVTLVGPGGGSPDNDGSDQMIRLREGVGGDFRNIVVANGNGYGIRVSDNASLALVDTVAPTGSDKNTLYFSTQNIIYNCSGGSLHGDVSSLLRVQEVNPLFKEVNPLTIPLNNMASFDPRPATGSPLLNGSDAIPQGTFFTNVNYRGAFDETNLWLKGWSWLDEAGLLP